MIEEAATEGAHSPPWTMKAAVFGLSVSVIPTSLVGVTVAVRWGEAPQDFYATAAQVIATLFVAIAIEYFSINVDAWTDALDRVIVASLIITSWLGLAAATRGILAGGSGWLAGLVASGMTAASVLVAWTLFDRVRNASLGTATVLLFLMVLLPLAVFVA